MSYHLSIGFSIPAIVIPLLLSMLVWIGAETKLRRNRRAGRYSIGGEILDEFTYSAISLGLTLIIWLGFLAVLGASR